ncbi:MAG: cytochrome c biogenesis protein [Ignavibacteria bacterium]|nr:cytochrome c biogenesis protein [Ignavibacteria bacterium]
MKPLVDILNWILPLLYILCFGVYTWDFIKDVRRVTNAKRLFLFLTLLTHTVYLLARTAAFQHPPITNVFEIFTVLAFSISLSYFILELVTDVRGTGLFIIILSFLFQIISSVFIEDLVEVREILRSNLLGVHVFHALLGYSALTISAVYGFLYLQLYNELKHSTFGLIFERLPNLEILEKLSFYSAVIGLIFITGAIAIGTIWLPRAFPNFSMGDPKLIATSLVWLVYAIGITARLTGFWHGKKIVWFSIVGFLIALCSTIVTNFISKSFHSFY